MKIYIVTDLEGPAGVNRWIQTREGENPEKHAAMRLLTREVNAAIDGILDAEPQAEIVVLDGHGSGGLWFDELHPSARYIMRGTGGLASFYATGPSFDGLMFVGQHAMAGLPQAPLCHTFSSRTVEWYRLNGELIGETGMIAAFFGERGVPTLFLSGDDFACREAEAIIPGIVTVATKEGLAVEQALHLSAEEARRQIRRGTTEAIRKIGAIAPYRVSAPYELEIRLLPGIDPTPYVAEGRYQLVGEQTVRRCADRMEDLR
ncbi:MAG TPA: M55 family metallopeptidase [Chthoniobacteraceae bacterium]|nr:M55 family metallopeptidase [Chthoniobacteraceae bacterium]